MSDIPEKNTPVQAEAEVETDSIINDSVAQPEQLSKSTEETFGTSEDRDISDVGKIVVPAGTKTLWQRALAAHVDDMVYWDDGKNPKPHLMPVAAGTVLNQIVPIRWLGDYLMVYIPELGHWAPARYLLTQMLTEFVPTLQLTYGLKQAKDIIEHAGVLSADYVNRDQPNLAELIAKTWDAQPFITFKNGDLHVPSMKLVPHHPDHRTTWGVPCDWDPTSTSAKLNQFLHSAVPDATGRKNYLAFVGYALARYDTSQHMFVYLKGHGSNGKSLALKLNRRLFGSYWSNTSLGKLVGSRFGASNLVFSALNFVGDQDAVFLSTTELLKELTGFDAIEAEKKFRDAFPFIAKTKFMFAVNSLPKTKDASHGFFRRPLITEFPTQFAQNDQYEKDLLSDDTVLQALAVQAIQAYRAMLKHGGFWIEGRTQELLDEYRADNDVVYAAVKDGLICADPNGKVERWSLTLLINFYGSERENQKISQSVIKERLGHAGIQCEEKRTSTEERAWYVHGIAVDIAQAKGLAWRAAVVGVDGQPMVSTGNGKRKPVAELLKAWGIKTEGGEGQVTDPDIAKIFGATRGDSTWI